MINEEVTLQIKGVPLIKFQSEDIIDQIQKGKIYANSLSYYRKLEDSKGDKRVGDQFEAMLHVNEGRLISKETGEVFELKDILIPTAHSNDYAFCMFSCDHTRMPFSFTEEQKSELLAMGDTALIITDNMEFQRRVKKAAKAQGFDAYFNYVRYFDESEDNANMLASTLQGVWALAFWKRKEYSYQQEARFVFSPYKEGAEHIELDIGDISDISYKAYTYSVLDALIRKHNGEDN